MFHHLWIVRFERGWISEIWRLKGKGSGDKRTGCEANSSRTIESQRLTTPLEIHNKCCYHEKILIPCVLSSLAHFRSLRLSQRSVSSPLLFLSLFILLHSFIFWSKFLTLCQHTRIWETCVFDVCYKQIIKKIYDLIIFRHTILNKNKILHLPSRAENSDNCNVAKNLRRLKERTVHAWM